VPFDPQVNFAYSLVAVAPSPADSGLSLELSAGTGVLFPDPGAQGYNVTVYPPDTGPLLSNAEIVRVTAKVGDILTIVRAREDSTAKFIAEGWQVSQAPTVAFIQSIIDALLPEAPQDGEAYVRKDGAWELLVDEIYDKYGVYSDLGAISFNMPLALEPTPFGDSEPTDIPESTLVAYYQRTDSADINLFSPLVSAGPAGRLFRFINQTADTFDLTCISGANLFFNGAAGFASALTVSAGETIDLQSIFFSGSRRWFVTSRYSAGGGGGGPTGPTGPTGPAGAASTVPGPTGPTGPAGAASTVAGPTGPTGPAGADSTVAGPTGPTGPAGAASTVAGPTGPTGPAGAASTVAGPTGPTGPAGAASTVAGPTGPTGPTGPAGAASTVAGPTGPTGPTGPAGAASTVPGPTGPTGPTGASGSGSADGWTDPSETWTYLSATTFTVAADVTAKYSKGDKIKFTQTTVKYFYIIAVSTFSGGVTTLTITGGTDYTLVNAAISANFYSKQQTPNAFPQWFNYTPSFTGFSANPTIGKARFCVAGNQCTMVRSLSGAGTSNATGYTETIPIVSVNSTNQFWHAFGRCFNSSAYVATPAMGVVFWNSSTLTFNLSGATANFTNTGTKMVEYFTLTYEI
jgi:hypothetical protein